MPFLENAIEIDTYLISEYPQVVALADDLFEKVKEVNQERAKTKNEEYRSKETLKILLINLVVAYDSGVAVQYSRRKETYSKSRRYGKIYFNYDRVISIVKILKKLGYIRHWTGFYDRKKNFGRQSRMAATNELIRLFEKHSITEIDFLGKQPPKIEDLVQMRDKEGNDIQYPDKKKQESMIEDLIRYNNLISEHHIEFRLSGDTLINLYFLGVRLKRMINIGTAKIRHLETNGFVRINRDDEEIYGYDLFDMRHLLWDGPGSDRAKNCLLHSHKVRHSRYRVYYNSYLTYLNTGYIDYRYDRDTKGKRVSKEEIRTTSMTGTFIENDEEIQILDIESTTTVRPHLRKRPLSNYGIHHLHFESMYQYLHRVFNIREDEAGRFYGAVHVNMPKEVRRCVSIDGKPACELDYKAHHIRMLYHERDIDYREDPYEKLCEGDLSKRPVYKIVSLVSINALDERDAMGGIRQQLRNHGIPFDLHNQSIKACIDKFKEVHSPIANSLNTARWAHLQYQDSRITNLILKRLVKEGVPCLPVHDSYVVPVECEKLLNDIMIDSYEKVMYGYTPVISKEF